jgi:hypothetical protein
LIREILRVIFSPDSSFVDRSLEVIMALLMPITVALIVFLGFTFVDSVWITPTKTMITEVEMKQVVPAYTTTMLVGKVMVPQFHPESYRLHFKIEGENISFTVEKKFFDHIRVGERIEIDYGLGRLSKSHKPTQIRLVTR